MTKTQSTTYNLQTTTLSIKGMHCNSCALSIDFDLEDLEGVKSAKTSYARQITEVEYDVGNISLEKIIEQIKKTGYEAY